MKMIGFVCIGALALAGCGESQKPEATAAASTNAAPEKSTAEQAIDGFTGKTVVDAGLRTKAKIEKIDAARRKDAEEAAKD